MNIADKIESNLRAMDKEHNVGMKYKYVSARLPAHIYYMMDMMATLDGSAVSTVLTEDISQKILNLLVMLLGNATDEEAVDIYNKLPESYQKKLEEAGLFDPVIDFGI